MTSVPPAVGDRIAPFTLATPEGEITIPDPSGRAVLLMFFIEAGTPLCAAQVGAIARDAELLTAANARVVAVSTDPPDRQRAFAEALGLREVTLATDEQGEVARRFGVYDETTRRARRAAFVIGGDGTVKVALPRYNPSNSEQYAALFVPFLDAEDGDG
jgi:peroxiredoxin